MAEVNNDAFSATDGDGYINKRCFFLFLKHVAVTCAFRIVVQISNFQGFSVSLLTTVALCV